MITQEQTPRILFEGITVEDFFERLEKIKTVEVLPMHDENLTVDEAAKFLKLGVPTLHRLKAAGKIPFTKIGARVIYRRSQLIEWLNAKAVKS